MKRFCLVLLAAVSTFTAVGSSQTPARLYVCNSGTGCDTGSSWGAGTSYSSVNAALAAASAGDFIYLQENQTFTENIVLPNKGALASRITIRSRAADSCFAAGRLVPTTRADGVTALQTLAADGTVITLPINGNTNPACLPTLVSLGAGEPTIRTATAAAVQDYTLQFLRFTNTPAGFNEIIRIGSTDGQEKISQQARDITMDRLLFEVDPLVGQKYAVKLDCANCEVTNSYMTNFVGLLQDAGCAAGTNGMGPISFTNNYCEGGGYGLITGGDNQRMYTYVSTAAGSTTTQIVYDEATFRPGHTESDMVFGAMAALVGEHIAIQVSTLTSVQREWAYVTAVDTTTNTLTVDADPTTVGNQPISTAPAAGLDVRWGAIYNGVTNERNHFYNHLKWQNSIIGIPQNVTRTESTNAGTLPAGTYYYVVTALKNNSYNNNNAYSTASAQVTCVLDAPGQCTIDWDPVTGATHYRVYGRGNATSTMYFTVAAPTTIFTDTGTTGTTGSRVSGSYWTLKNYHETKQGRQVRVRYNIFENKWYNSRGGTMSGTPLWIKSNVQGTTGFTYWNQTRDVLIEFNWMLNVGGCLHMTSQEETGIGIERRPNYLEDVIFRHNLVISRPEFGASNQPCIAVGYQGPKNTTIENNTLFHTVNAIFQFQSTQQPWAGTRRVADNIFWMGSYGATSEIISSFGEPAIDLHLGNENYLNNAVHTGNTAYPQPSGTIRVTRADQEAKFVAFGSRNVLDWDLDPGDPWRTAGTSGDRLGADIPTLATFLTGVREGIPSNAPQWQTAAGPLTQATVGSAYSATLVVTGGTGAKTCSISNGALPTGLTISAGCAISGTPGVGMSNVDSTFTVRATDTASLTADRVFSIFTNPANITVEINTTTLANAMREEPYDVQIQGSGPAGTQQWSYTGQLPQGIQLNATTGRLTGAPLQTGTFSFTARLQIGGSSDTQVLTLTVVPPVRPVPENSRQFSWNGQELGTFARCDLTVTDDEVKEKDLCVDANNVLNIVTSTAPAVTITPVSTGGSKAHEYITIYSNPTAIAVTAAATGTNFTSGAYNPYINVDTLTAGYTQIRLVVTQTSIGAAGSTATIQCSTDDGSNWVETGATIDMVTSSSSPKTGAWGTLAAACKDTDTWLRFRLFGDGVANPAFRIVSYELRVP